MLYGRGLSALTDPSKGESANLRYTIHLAWQPQAFGSGERLEEREGQESCCAGMSVERVA